MLLEGKPQYVGSTIHYIDRGIDSGNIIRTIQIPMSHNDPYEFIDAKSFLLGTNEMVESIRAISQGTAPRIPQWTEGKVFLRKTGYEYSPYLRLKANRMIQKGLIARYLESCENGTPDVRLVS